MVTGKDGWLDLVKIYQGPIDKVDLCSYIVTIYADTTSF